MTAFSFRLTVPMLLATALIFDSAAAQGAPQRQSRAPGSLTSNSLSGLPDVSDDGRFVAFMSAASDLIAGDTNSRSDIFVRDRLTGSIDRVSIATGGAQANGHSYWPSISADGNLIVFYSDANNLVAGDTNGVFDIFVRNRSAGTTVRVSQAAGVQANIRCDTPEISADGAFVCFESQSSNLVPGDTTAYDAFVVNLATGAIEIASRGPGGNLGDGSSFLPSISADGRYVCFHGTSSNLVPGDTNGARDVFRHDRLTGQTIRCSVDSSGVQGNDRSWRSRISADGRFVAFNSAATNLVPGDTNGTFDVFVHDAQTGVTERVSVATGGGQGTGNSGTQCQPTLSADGRYVGFLTGLSDLVAGDTALFDAFVHDRLTGTTRRVDVDAAGAAGVFGASANISDGVFSHPDRINLSADGQVVVFPSGSTNLFPGDTAGFENVYATDLGASATSLGPATLGGYALVKLAAPTYAGSGYIAAFAFDYQNGLPLPGGWVMPLDGDPLFSSSVGAGGTFLNMVGTVDAGGGAQWGVPIPQFPWLIGLPLVSAAAIVDGAAPLGLWSVSNTVAFTIQ